MVFARFFQILFWCSLLHFVSGFARAEPVEISGLIIPRDHDGIYIRTPEGQFEVTWTADTKVALTTNTRLLAGLKGNTLTYKIHSSKQHNTYQIPAGPITGEIKIRNVEKQLPDFLKEKWIPEFGLRVFFNQKPEKEQIPTKSDPRFIGTWDPTTKPRTLTVNGTKFEVSLKKGGQTSAQLFGILTTKDLNPFVNRATVIGRKNGASIVADEIHVEPIGDQTANDDPNLPRYLFIGDSISGNYDKGLREELAGKFNIHHPPTNCGPSRKGRASIIDWLGAFEEKGRHWDVISFNPNFFRNFGAFSHVTH